MIHIISVRHLAEFLKGNPQYKKAIEAWATIVKQCDWTKPLDIVEEFGTKAIDILPNFKGESCERVVFDIRGNNLRIIAKYRFHPKLKKTRLYLCWIGTHKDYDKICLTNKQYTINNFL
ncbi:type II toxin-antitoxin system HigB family toxin [Lacinutrix jangbogonensis]|uniref:type II toxin-antitoxin system HigB family toxin n=1 Tax=Lacinutrix jangbogonensis TaxID=1469557 RepID=UPI00053DADB4|nr:type II toxin-antitoxin system HigB family toxin [Lacinutrix jangbogonensis]